MRKYKAKRIGTGVRRIAPGRYEFRVTRHGSAISETFDAGSDAEAKKRHRQWLVDVEAGRIRPASGTVTELLDRYIELKTTQGRAQTTLALYRGLAEKHICPAIGSKQVTRLKTAELDALYAVLLAAGIGVVTVRKVHSLLRGALGQAVRWEMIATNPAANASPPPEPARSTAEFTPDVDQVRRLLVTLAESPDQDFSMIVRLAAATGLRRGEICGLQWRDCDLEARRLHVRRAVVAVKGGTSIKSPKSGRERALTFDAETADLLRLHRKRSAEDSLAFGTPLSDDSFVFSSGPASRTPVHPSTVTHKFKALAIRAGIPELTFHGLRHFHVSALLGAGEDVVTVSKRVGHARPSITTDIYAHALPERDREVADRIGDILGGAVDSGGR